MPPVDIYLPLRRYPSVLTSSTVPSNHLLQPTWPLSVEEAMNKDPRQQWEDVVSKANEAGAVLALAEILADKEGRCLVSHLGRKEAEICIGVLDRVSRELWLTLFCFL